MYIWIIFNVSRIQLVVYYQGYLQYAISNILRGVKNKNKMIAAESRFAEDN